MLDATSFDAALKNYYSTDKVEELVYKKRPFLGLVSKKKDFYGKVGPFDVYYGNPQGRSSNFIRAQVRGKATSSKIACFLLTRVQDYGFINIDRETMMASENDKGAFLRAKTTEINGMINSLMDSLAQAVAGDGWGVVGQIKAGSSVSGTTLTLALPNTVVFFEVGQELGAAAAISSGAARAYGSSGNGLIITAIDRDAGTLTFAYNANDPTNGIVSLAASDYLFIRGDRQEGSSPVREKMCGVQAWIPDTAPSTGESFFGVDRSVDATRLAGLRKDYTGYPIEEALIDAAAYGDREGAQFSHFMMSPATLANLIKAQGSRTQFVDVMVTATIGYRGVKVQGPNGEIICLGDKTWRDDRIHGIDIDSWTLWSLGDAPQVVNDDGLEMLRMSDTDGYEMRWAYYSQTRCDAPGHNMTMKI